MTEKNVDKIKIDGSIISISEEKATVSRREKAVKSKEEAKKNNANSVPRISGSEGIPAVICHRS